MPPNESIVSRIMRRLDDGPATKRDLHRLFNSHVSGSILDELMSELVEDGEVEEEYVETGQRGKPFVRFKKCLKLSTKSDENCVLNQNCVLNTPTFAISTQENCVLNTDGRISTQENCVLNQKNGISTQKSCVQNSVEGISTQENGISTRISTQPETLFQDSPEDDPLEILAPHDLPKKGNGDGSKLPDYSASGSP